MVGACLGLVGCVLRICYGVVSCALALSEPSTGYSGWPGLRWKQVEACLRHSGQGEALAQRGQEFSTGYVGLPIGKARTGELQDGGPDLPGDATSLEVGRAAMARWEEGDLESAAQILVADLVRHPGRVWRSGSMFVEGRSVIPENEVSGYVWRELVSDWGSGALCVALELANEWVATDLVLAARALSLAEDANLTEDQSRLMAALLQSDVARGVALSHVDTALGIFDGGRQGKMNRRSIICDSKAEAVLVPAVLGATISIYAEIQSIAEAEAALDRLGRIGVLYPEFRYLCLSAMSLLDVSVHAWDVSPLRDYWLVVLDALSARRPDDPRVGRLGGILESYPWWDAGCPVYRRPPVIAGAEAAFWRAVLRHDVQPVLWLQMISHRDGLQIPRAVWGGLSAAILDDPGVAWRLWRSDLSYDGPLPGDDADPLLRVVAYCLAIRGQADDGMRRYLLRQLAGALMLMPTFTGAGANDYVYFGVSEIARYGYGDDAYVSYLFGLVRDWSRCSVDAYAAAVHALATLSLSSSKQKDLVGALDARLISGNERAIFLALGRGADVFLPELERRALGGSILGMEMLWFVSGDPARMAGPLNAMAAKDIAVRDALELLVAVDRHRWDFGEAVSMVRKLCAHPAPEVRERARSVAIAIFLRG